MNKTDNPGLVSPASDASGAAAPGQTDAPQSPSAELNDLDRLMAELDGEEGDVISAAESTPDADTDHDDSAPADGDTETTEADPDEDEAEGDESDAESEDGEDDEEKEEAPKEEKAKQGGGMPKAIADTLKAANVPKGIMDRIGKTFEKARERAAEVERLTTELAKAGPVAVLQPDAASPLSAVRTEEDLAKSKEAARKWIDWAIENPQGGTLPNGKELDAETTRAMHAQAVAVLEQIPERRQWLAEYAESAKAVRAEMPELFKEGTWEHAVGQNFIKKCPELLKVSDHHRFIQWAVAGARAAREAAEGKKTVTVDPKAMREAGERLKEKAAAAKKPAAAVSALPKSRPAPASAQSSRDARLKAAEDSRDVKAMLDELLA